MFYWLRKNAPPPTPFKLIQISQLLPETLTYRHILYGLLTLDALVIGGTVIFFEDMPAYVINVKTSWPWWFNYFRPEVYMPLLFLFAINLAILTFPPKPEAPTVKRIEPPIERPVSPPQIPTQPPKLYIPPPPKVFIPPPPASPPKKIPVSQPHRPKPEIKKEPVKPPVEEMVDKRYLEPVKEEPKAVSYQTDLERLVGMAGPKAEVLRLANMAGMVQKRKEAGLPPLSNTFHMVFTGNPGTGKTTFARIIAKVLHQHNILPREGIVEVDRSELVGKFIGHSEAAIKKHLENALGRVLFIDEFYALVNESGNDFGKQVIDVLVKFMEDHRENICVIIAGYTEPMKKAIASNPGLKSRFNRTIHFPDYEAEELIDIFDRMLREKQYTLEDDAYPVVGKVVKTHHAGKSVDFGNARDMRTLFERLTDVQANRVMSDNSSLTVITAQDVREAAALCGMT